MIPVKATQRGFYGSLREADDKFEVAEEKHLSAAWMKRVDGKPIARKPKAAPPPPAHLDLDRAALEQQVADLEAQARDDAEELDRLREQVAQLEADMAAVTDVPDDAKPEVLTPAGDANAPSVGAEGGGSSTDAAGLPDLADG